MRIGIDVDGVLRDFVSAFKGVVGQEYPNAQIPEMISTWKFENEITGLTEEEIREIYKEKFSKQCFQEALPFSEAVPSFWTLEKWAEQSDTIPYELCCGVARRLYRIYKWKNQHYEWHELKVELGVKEPLFNVEF